MQVKQFTFNPFDENTYVLYDDTGQCAIVDPGCYDRNEQDELTAFISEEKLTPVRLINTHCHLDHVFGVPFVTEHYGLPLEIHEGELVVLNFAQQSGMMYGTPVGVMPAPGRFIREGETITFGNTSLEVLLTPGHSPASICFYDRKGGNLISGDVLFSGSIGRTDLPGGDYATLMLSITQQLMTLPDSVVVYPGHMESTTIGHERITNPFILEWMKVYSSRNQD